MQSEELGKEVKIACVESIREFTACRSDRKLEWRKSVLSSRRLSAACTDQEKVHGAAAWCAVRFGGRWVMPDVERAGNDTFWLAGLLERLPGLGNGWFMYVV